MSPHPRQKKMVVILCVLTFVYPSFVQQVFVDYMGHMLSAREIHLL